MMFATSSQSKTGCQQLTSQLAHEWHYELLHTFQAPGRTTEIHAFSIHGLAITDNDRCQLASSISAIHVYLRTNILPITVGSRKLVPLGESM